MAKIIPIKKIESWSFSRYSVYSECPRKAKFKFIDKLLTNLLAVVANRQKINITTYMEEKIDEILLANFAEGDWITAQKQLLDLFNAAQQKQLVSFVEWFKKHELQ